MEYLYAFTGARLVLCLVSDTFLVSTLPISANLGVNGIGYSNIIVNALLLAVSLILLTKEEIKTNQDDRNYQKMIVSEVIEKVRLHHFSNVFKKETGLSPLVYKKGSEINS